MISKWGASVVATVATLALSTACTAVADRATTAPVASPHVEARPVSPEPSIARSSQLELPVAKYATTPEQLHLYLRGVTAAQANCARRFAVRSTMPVPVQTTDMEDAAQRRYGVVNEVEVRQYGYQLPPQREGREWSPTPRELEVMTGQTGSGSPSKIPGLPPGGCAAEGFRLVWGSSEGPSRDEFAQRILATAWELTKADDAALAAARDWSECMAREGYEFQHRWDAGNSVRSASTEQKRAMAVLDLECAKQTNYVGIWHAIDAAYQSQLINEYKDELLAAQRDIEELTARAQAFVVRRTRHGDPTSQQYPSVRPRNR